MREIGNCKLCLLPNKELRESHFVPKAAYKTVQMFGGVTPLIIKGDVAVQKNRQLKAFLLCVDCEDRFNKNGEAWVMNHCNRPEIGFRLSRLIQRSEPEIVGPGLKMYSTASLPEIDVAKLAYFVSSILWRGSVHRWKWDREAPAQLNLGKKYEEEFRRYLSGATDLPKNVVVQVFLMSNPLLSTGFAIPYQIRLQNGTSRYTFTFLGITFQCFVGNLIEDDVRRLCVYRSPQKYMFVGEEVDKAFLRDIAPTLEKSRHVGVVRI